MNEPWQEKGFSGMEEFRHIQNLAKDGRLQEALDRAVALLEIPRLGRKLEAKVHNLICRLYTEGYSRPGTSAVLHGEEAVRLAELLHDPWLKCEALAQLAVAYCRTGDYGRAKAACDEIRQESERNPGVVSGGEAAAWSLQALVCTGTGDLEGAMDALSRAEEKASAQPDGSRVLPEIRAHRVELLLLREETEQAQQLLEEDRASTAATDLQRAWLAAMRDPTPAAREAVEATLARAQMREDRAAIAQCLALRAILEQRDGSGGASRLARQAVDRAIEAGRADLTHRFRRRLATLLESGG